MEFTSQELQTKVTRLNINLLRQGVYLYCRTVKDGSYRFRVWINSVNRGELLSLDDALNYIISLGYEVKGY